MEECRSSAARRGGALAGGEVAAAERAPRTGVAGGKLNALQTTLAECENALALAGKAAEQARESSQREAQEVLRKAETAWKSAEADRLAAAEALWQEQSAKALAETQAHAIGRATIGEEMSRCRRCARRRPPCRKSCATRCGTDLCGQGRRAGATQLAARDARHFAAAERDWKAQEAVRASAVEAQLRKDSAGALAETMARCDAAEAALAQARLSPRTTAAYSPS